MPKANTISSLLAAKGHRLTPSRRAVVEAALRSDDLFSVADVQRLVPRIGRATVFRTDQAARRSRPPLSRSPGRRHPALPAASGARRSPPPSRVHRLWQRRGLLRLRCRSYDQKRRRSHQLPDTGTPAGALRPLSRRAASTQQRKECAMSRENVRLTCHVPSPRLAARSSLWCWWAWLCPAAEAQAGRPRAARSRSSPA